MRLKKVLIVDDNDDFRGMLKDYLKRHNLGLEIFEASTGEMGIAKASCVRPDIVLMDINLPHSNGFETTKHIKEDHPDCHVIILTLFEVRILKEAAKGIRAADFIGKSEIDERLIPAMKRCFKSNQTTARGRKLN